MRDEFLYGECPNCGNIQIMEVPDTREGYPFEQMFTIAAFNNMAAILNDNQRGDAARFYLYKN
ncbi:MAG: hypothetical protein JWQ85_1162 [Mucilaginibacter sp.]|nr:hypothetical protein [Mucilaginibacter sp.]